MIGLLVAQQTGVDGTGALIVAAIGSFLAYLVGCAIAPLRACWWCSGRAMLTDGRGNMREKPCWRCNRKRVLRRPGARLIGAKGRRE